MITLYAFGPQFDLPDPSPFVTKAEVRLKMAGLAYRTDLKGFRTAPKGKLPYIEDGGERIADSTFIRWHIEKKIEALAIRGIDAIASYLGPKPFFMGAEPAGVDATMFAFAANALCPEFDTPIRTAAERHDNLRRYVGRMTARYYPERSAIAGCRAA